jgi:hypothetical protein
MATRKVKLKCPICGNGIYFESEFYNVSSTHRTEENAWGYALFSGSCPLCNELIICREKGELFIDDNGETMASFKNTEILYPTISYKEISQEVPEKYKKDFLEACAVLPVSSKASAALSRRILQDILRGELGIQKPNLAQEIDEFIQKTDVPSYLTEAVDAVRNIGNFAAHPLKDTNTGLIIEVETGEAEWLLEVNEALFDFVFVQPKRLQERKNNLNAKLTSIGKPLMKS